MIRRAGFGLVALAVALAAVGPVVAAYRALVVVGGNSFTTASSFTTSWHFPQPLYLRAGPLPTSGHPTQTNVDLPMDGTAPTMTTLVAYDACAGNRPGRTVVVSTLTTGETDVCRYVNWRSAAAPAPVQLTGTAIVTIWAQTTRNRPWNLTAYLRDFSAGTGSFVPIATGSVGGTDGSVLTLGPTLETISLTNASYTLPAGHILDLRVVLDGSPTAQPNVAEADLQLAYDVTTYSATLMLP